MIFRVYCDESYPDLFSSETPYQRYLVIGGLWCPVDFVEIYKREIHKLRTRHRVGGEFKWAKVSPSRQDFYVDLVRWFVEKGLDLRFRAIVVDSGKVNLDRFHDGDQELGFYKFYYQLLHHWILTNNSYEFYLDHKSNRRRDRLREFERVLRYANLFSTIVRVQSEKSEHNVLIQTADVLTGMTAAVFNQTLRPDSAKAAVVQELESKLGTVIRSTPLSERKFNVFEISLAGGW